MGAGRSGYLESLDIKITDWSIEREKKYLRRIDIGIMPLRDDEWSRGKGGYKLLQYMATGISCVGSPVGVNKEIIEEGNNGFLASDNDEWYKKLEILIKDRNLRQAMGRNARQTAEEKYSVEKVYAKKFISVLYNAANKT